MVALHLANALLDAEDPKEFLKRMSAKQADLNKRRGGRPAEEWEEWPEMEEWAQVAVKQLEDEEDMYFTLVDRHEHDFTVSNGKNFQFKVYRSEDAAIDEASNQVRDDLENSPENFNQDWLHHHIDLDNLRHQLHQDARDDDYWNEKSPDYESKLEELIDRDYYSDDPRDDTGGEITPELESEIDDKWEEMIEEFANNRLQDPIEFLEEIYGREDAVKKAMEWGGINIDAAVTDALNTDGWQHFISRYDGHSHDLPCGAVYVRE